MQMVRMRAERAYVGREGRVRKGFEFTVDEARAKALETQRPPLAIRIEGKAGRGNDSQPGSESVIAAERTEPLSSKTVSPSLLDQDPPRAKPISKRSPASRDTND